MIQRKDAPDILASYRIIKDQVIDVSTGIVDTNLSFSEWITETLFFVNQGDTSCEGALFEILVGAE